MSHVPPPLNLIPPTPLKADDDASPHSTQGGHTFTRASGQQLDLSYHPANGIQERFPEKNSNHIDHKSGGLEQSLMGRRSSEANEKLEEGFALLDHIFNDLTKSTMMPTNQVINTFLKSHGQEVHSRNYWNIYANYFKAYKERELARLKNGKGKGKETQNVELHGTPALQTSSKLGMLDSASMRFGFEAAVVFCGNIINQDASLDHVHTTQSAAGVFEMHCHANDDTIIGHLKAHAFNATSLSVVEDTFCEGEDDICDGDASFLKDDMPDIQAIGDPLKWLKQELSLTSCVLANENLCIKGYPAHKCLLPGKYHNINAKSKGALIASEIPMITGEAPPSDYPHARAQQMFANCHTDYNGPSHVKISTATTKVKKTQNTRKLPSNSQQESTTTGLLLPKPPPSHLFIVVPRPPSASPKLSPGLLLPMPPSHPFIVVPRPPPALPKPSSTDVIKLYISESEDEPREMVPETGFEDAFQGEKRKVADSRPHQVLKRCAPSAEDQVETNVTKKNVKAQTKRKVKEKVQGTMKPLPAPGAPPIKGGPLSPLTVSSSSDELLARVGTSQLQHAKRLRDGPIKPHPIIPGSRYILSHTHRIMYSDESEEGNKHVAKQVAEKAADAPVIPPPLANVQQAINEKYSSDAIASEQGPVQSPIPQHRPLYEDNSHQVLHHTSSEPVDCLPEPSDPPQHIPEPNNPPQHGPKPNDPTQHGPKPNKPPMRLSRDTSRNPSDHDQRAPHMPFTHNLPLAEPQHLESHEPVLRTSGWHEPPDRGYDTRETKRNDICNGPYYPHNPIQYHHGHDRDDTYTCELSPWNHDGVVT
ncbi:uncharacterized protein EDB93DRAFT_1109721 [Suillus bovinus]|uniref:uncharacterized protein n=1 Tax=Suillus bovinus TaxID=48563 RepID=UPI001B86BA96|nr:uncharacterized protein EDB93DRAFT_1109721 [Suillus bovinus]KAG2126327.1 hypothetical protein EDB93DRAFT_1109721 [Suillus bovinus]